MKIWDKNKNIIPSFSEALGIKKDSVIQIAGSGGKTTLSYILAKENSHLKVAVVTSTKRFAPEKDALMLKESEILDTEKIKGNFVEVGILDEIGKMGWLGDENYLRLKTWADIIVAEVDGSKRLPLKACADYEPVLLEDATHTIVVCGLSALGQNIEDVCHRYTIVNEDIKEGTKVSEKEIIYLLERFYKNRFNDTDITFVLNQADDESILDTATQILKNLNGFACKMVE